MRELSIAITREFDANAEKLDEVANYLVDDLDHPDVAGHKITDTMIHSQELTLDSDETLTDA
jgi:hypothetical protein